MINLSIIIPVYNEFNFLDLFTIRLLNSFKNIETEYIFVNDGSDDGSEKWLENFCKENKQNNCKLINITKNSGKGNAIHQGIKIALGKYILFQDADLELDTEDSKEMFNIINNNKEIKCLFGSRYLSGKLKKNNNYLNEFIGKLNSLIFNLLFDQSLSDLHCGTKIISKDVLDSINLTVKDFGFEIDISSQIAKKKYDIYEYGISFFSRSKLEGKKITWIDGIKSYYYLFKTRFIQNDISTTLSIIFSLIYMGYLGSLFSSGILNMISILSCLIIGLFIGLHRKILSSFVILLSCLLAIFISSKNIEIYSIILFFFIGLYLSKKLSRFLNKKNKNNFINSLF